MFDFIDPLQQLLFFLSTQRNKPVFSPDKFGALKSLGSVFLKIVGAALVVRKLVETLENIMSAEVAATTQKFLELKGLITLRFTYVLKSTHVLGSAYVLGSAC